MAALFLFYAETCHFAKFAFFLTFSVKSLDMSGDNDDNTYVRVNQSERIKLMLNSPRKVNVLMHARLDLAPRTALPALGAGVADAVNEWLDGEDEAVITSEWADISEYNYEHERRYVHDMGKDMFFDWGYYKWAERNSDSFTTEEWTKLIDSMNAEAERLYDEHWGHVPTEFLLPENIEKTYEWSGNRFPA